MSSFPKTVSLLSDLDLGHFVEEVSPHGISAIGYLRVKPQTRYPIFTPWPAGVDGAAIYRQYLQETVHFTEERIGTEREQRGLAIVDLVNLCAGTSRDHGFHQEGDALRATLATAQLALEDAEQRDMPGADYYYEDVNAARAAYTNYLANRLLLVVSEVIEAHDDLRSGFRIDAVWYENKAGERSDTQHDEYQKPCGPVSEIIDILIRVFDLIGEAGLAQVAARLFVEKDAYNVTRPFKHGKQF